MTAILFFALVLPLCAQSATAAGTSRALHLRQRFFAEIKAKQYPQAIADGKAYLARHPNDDEFALNLAYAEIAGRDTNAAKRLLQRLAYASNPALARRARAQLTAMTAPSARAYAYPPGYLYAYAENDSRFGDNFVGASARYDLAKGAVIPYASLSISDDTRSGAPPIAQIYSTDAVTAALGVRVPFGIARYGYAFANGGYSVGLRAQPSLWATQYGIAYSRDYGSLRSPLPHVQIGGSAIVYSRFAGNGIAYLQASYDAKLTRSLRAIVGTNVGLDTQRLYYNNFAEAYGGVVAPLSKTLSLRVVGVVGQYLSRGLNIPARSSYTSVRTLLVYGIDFGRARP